MCVCVDLVGTHVARAPFVISPCLSLTPCRLMVSPTAACSPSAEHRKDTQIENQKRSKIDACVCGKEREIEGVGY